MKKGNVIVLCILLATGFGALALWKSIFIYRGIQSNSWPSVLGKVIKTAKEEIGASVLEYTSILYDYQVGGTVYQNQRLSFRAFSDQVDQAAKEAKPGMEVRVYYNPQMPSVSVWVPGANFMDYLIAIVFWVLSGLALYGSWTVHKDDYFD